VAACDGLTNKMAKQGVPRFKDICAIAWASLGLPRA